MRRGGEVGQAQFATAKPISGLQQISEIFQMQFEIMQTDPHGRHIGAAAAIISAHKTAVDFFIGN